MNHIHSRILLIAGVALLAACQKGESSTGGADAAASGGGDQPGPGSGAAPGSGGTMQGAGSGGSASGGSASSGGAPASGGAPGTGAINGAGGATTGGGGMSTQASGGRTGDAGGTSGRQGTSSGGQSAGSGGIRGTGGNGATGGATGTGVGHGGNSGSTGTGGMSSMASAGPPETKPLGYGQATTGGGSTPEKQASSLTEVQALIDAYSGSGGLTIRFTGHFDFSSITDPCTQWQLPGQIVEIKKKNDITLLGADGSAANFGVHIASSSSNIIVRNMTFGLLPGGDAADAISLEGMSGGFPTDVWIDHNELFSSMATCAGAGDSSFDGLIDMKKGADRVTVSYNYLHDHHKVSLNGYSDSDTAVRHVTFHHNIFQNVASRTPLQRGGYSHLLNNVFDTIDTSGINVRMNGYSLIEGNYFSNVENPITSRDSSALGFWDIRASNNVTSPADFATYGITWAPSSSTPTADATNWTTTSPYPVALGYTYPVDAAACVHAGLSQVAGAGKGLATLKCK